MPTLRRWFEQEYARLDAAGKSPLVDAFDAFSGAYFDGDTFTALNALPGLHALAEALHEPVWQVVTDYYEASASLSWQGHVGHALDVATRATVCAQRLGEGIPALYTREVLLYAWLDTDAPGTAPRVRQAVDELSGEDLPPDLADRFRLVQAHGLAACGEGEQAARIALGALPSLGWPAAYEHGLRAAALGWQGRWQEASAQHRRAARAFDALGHRIERNGARLAAAEGLLAAGDAEAALTAAERVREDAVRTVNRAHVGSAEGLVGRALAALGEHALAADWFAVGLETLDGRGWLRLEAELALERLRALRATGLNGSQWAAALDAAETRVARLRSGDLERELKGLV